MNLEEMIETLNASVLSNRLPNGMGLRMFKCDVDKIIAVLLAAETMRDCGKAAKHSETQWKQAVKTYDAATKRDDK